MALIISHPVPYTGDATLKTDCYAKIMCDALTQYGVNCMSLDLINRSCRFSLCIRYDEVARDGSDPAKPIRVIDVIVSNNMPHYNGQDDYYMSYNDCFAGLEIDMGGDPIVMRDEVLTRIYQKIKLIEDFCGIDMTEAVDHP